MDGWQDDWMAGSINQPMARCIVASWTDEWLVEWMHGSIEGDRQKDVSIDLWMTG